MSLPNVVRMVWDLHPAVRLNSMTVYRYVEGLTLTMWRSSTSCVSSTGTCGAPPGSPTRADGPGAPYVQVMRDVISADRFPALAHMIETGALGVIDAPDNPDPAGFEFGVDRILGSIQ